MWKLAGVVCFIFATLLLSELAFEFGTYARGTIEYLVFLALTILLYSLSIVGIFGRRFGALPYTICGLSFFITVVFEWTDIAITYQEYPDLISAIASFALFSVFLYPSYQFIRRGYLVSISRLVLGKWDGDVPLTRNDVSKILAGMLMDNRNLPLEHPLLEVFGSARPSPDEIIKLLLGDGRIRKITEDQFQRV